MLRLRSAADRPVRQLPAGRFQTGGCRLSGLRLGVFRLSGFGFPGGFRLGNFSMLFDSVRRLRIAGIPGIRSGLNVFG